MKMFKTLLLSRLQSVLASLITGARKKKSGKAFGIFIGILMLYVVVVFTAMFAMLAWEICEPFHLSHIDWFYFTLFSMLAFCLMFFMSIFATYSQLYEAKDNELLLSMPIPTHYILASRMASLLVMNYGMELIVLAPAAVVYGIRVGYSSVGLLSLLLVALALPFFALAISSIFGFLIALVVSRVRNKSVVSMVMSLAFIFAYLYLYTKMFNYVSVLISDGAQIAEVVSPILPLYMLGNSIAAGNILHALFVLLIALLPFFAVYIVLSLSFARLATKKAKSKKAKRYGEENIRESGMQTALFKKELSHYLSSAGYMLNATIGVVFQLIAAVFLIVKWREVGELAELLSSVLSLPVAPLVLLASVFFCSTNIMTGASVSIDAKIMWITHSMPVPPFAALKAKLRLALAVTLLPSLLLSGVCVALIPMSIIEAICVVVGTAAFVVFMALFGLFVNIHLPKFDWTSETVAVKQGISTLVSMFAPYILVVPACVIAYATESYSLVMYAFCAIVIILDVSLHVWLRTRGAHKYSRLVGA